MYVCMYVCMYVWLRLRFAACNDCDRGNIPGTVSSPPTTVTYLRFCRCTRVITTCTIHADLSKHSYIHTYIQYIQQKSAVNFSCKCVLSFPQRPPCAEEPPRRPSSAALFLPAFQCVNAEGDLSCDL